MAEMLERRIIQKRIASGGEHVVGLKWDGTVVSTGKNESGQCNTSSWKGIISVSAGSRYTVGLCEDLTVVATGKFYMEGRFLDVSSWKDIIDISAGHGHIVGLRHDGTVVTEGDNDKGQCNVSDWNDIVAVSAGSEHTVGLKSDGTVIAVGENMRGQCNTKDWKDIVFIDAGADKTLGVRKDGTVLSTAYDNSKNWHNIVSVSVGDLLDMVGLQSDGRVVCGGQRSTAKEFVPYWSDIVEVHSGFTVLGLRSDGRIMAIGNEAAQNRFKSWKLLLSEQEKKEIYDEATGFMGSGSENSYRLAYDKFKMLRGYKNSDTLKNKCQEEYTRLKIERLEKEKKSLMSELEHISGIFAGMKRKKIENRLEAIKSELQK